jgi:flagellar protein FliS
MTQTVSTMKPGQLLVALYDKAIVELNKALIFIEDKNIPKAHISLMRVGDIIDALDGSLKVKYEITNSLAALYQYFRECLVRANVKKDPELIRELLPYFEDLRNTFAEADKIA